MPHISLLNYSKGVTLALSLPRCVSTLLPPSKYLTYLLLSVFVGILFCKAKGPGPFIWPLAWWLGFSALSAVEGPQSIAGN